MPAYIVLGSYTDQGIRNIKQLTGLRQAAEGWVSSKNGRIIANYVTFGAYDFVFIVDLPSDDVALEGAFLFGSQGDIRSTTMRAFSAEEAEAIAQRVP